MLKQLRTLILPLVTLLLISCTTKQNVTTVSSTNTGRIVNQCLAIHNPDLKPGTVITAISLNGQPLSSDVSIQSNENSENCTATKNEQNVNNDDDLHFYTVNTSSEFGLGIGTMIQDLKITKNESVVYVDFDNNGSDEAVTFCTTSEGLSFDIWQHAPYEDKPLWTAYHYLGYDVERSCP